MEELLRRVGVDINVNISFIIFSLIWVRTLTMATMVPFLFGKPVPRVVVVGASATLAVFAYPFVAPATPPTLPNDFMYLIMLYLKEAFYGFAIGFSVSVLFNAFQSVGQMIDNQRGVAIARLVIPQLGQQASLSGMFIFQFALVLYLTFGGHRVFFEGFFNSFQALPIFAFPAAGPGMLSLIDLLAKMAGMIFVISLQLAGPVIIAILLVDIIMGIANRIAPQINVWEMSFNVKGYIGILLLFVSITMIGKQIYRYTYMANTTSAKAVWYLQGHETTPPEEEAGPEEGMPKPQEGPPSVITE